MRKRSKLLVAVLLSTWLAAIIWGAKTLLVYENTPAQAAQAPVHWPANSKLVRTKPFTLVMLAHPNCPCTRASLAELELIMAQLQGSIGAYIVFSKPGATAAEIAASDLWRKAKSIPGVSAVYDSDGRETERFAGKVSGQSMLYDRDGTMVFSGGITAARGHQGDNEGVDALVRLVRGDHSTFARAPVFGCSLHNPTGQVLEKDRSWTKQ